MSQSLRKAELYASWMPRSPRWYVAAIMAGYEATAVEHCSRQGFELYVPMLLDRRIDQGKRIEVRRPRFKGYGFVALDLDQDQWRSVNGTRGVRHLLPLHLERPSPLPMGFIERLQAEPEKAEEIIIAFAVDDMVRFIAGPFASYTATILSQDGGMLRARLELGAIVHAAVDTVEPA
jgi:transcription antitermination factor NusG